MAQLTRVPARRSGLNSFGNWLDLHWFAVFLTVYGLWVWLPWLAPVAMHAGWNALGSAIYGIYSFFCHQLPERSFFLFGPKSMYSLGEIQAAWQQTINPAILRQFIGTQAMGWKLGWSDRMVSFFTSVWIFGVLWWPLRRKVKPLPPWGFALLLLPIVLDGGSHMVSDLAGIGRGFRDSNLWLASLTHNSLPVSFYAGDVLGSFNSMMRLITGVLAGLSIDWLALPFIYNAQILNRKLEQLDYGKVLEQVKTRDQSPAGG